jgi:hypothetical protein
VIGTGKLGYRNTITIQQHGQRRREPAKERPAPVCERHAADGASPGSRPPLAVDLQLVANQLAELAETMALETS